MEGFRGLIAWQKAMDVVVSVYEVTDRFPARERFGLADQMNRAAISVPSNIAEGRGRGTPREYRKYLLIARGSLYELATQVEIAKRLRFIGEAEAQHLSSATAEVARILNGLIRVVSTRHSLLATRSTRQTRTR